MFTSTRWNPIQDIVDFQREADRLFTRLRHDLPVRAARPAATYPFTVHTSEDSWRLELPMPGIDPKHVAIDVAGDTIVVRAEEQGGRYDGETRYQQSMTVPRFFDLDRLTASHRHGMLELTLPLKDSVKPRRIPIEGIAEDQTQLATV